jgi:hypothetical protein
MTVISVFGHPPSAAIATTASMRDMNRSLGLAGHPLGAHEARFIF